MDIGSGSKRMQMFILKISQRLACGQPCGARPHMKGSVGFEGRSGSRPAAHGLAA